MFSPLVNTTCSLSCFEAAAAHTTRFCQNRQRDARRVRRSRSRVFKGASPRVKTEPLTSQTPCSYITHSIFPSLVLPPSFLTSPPSLLVLLSPLFVLVDKRELGQTLQILTVCFYCPLHSHPLKVWFFFCVSCPAKYLLSTSEGN